MLLLPHRHDSVCQRVELLAIDFAILFLLNGVGLNKYVANLISTSVAFSFSFFANRSLTFQAKMNAKRQTLPFLFVTLADLWLLQPLVIWLVGMALSSLDDVLRCLLRSVLRLSYR